MERFSTPTTFRADSSPRFAIPRMLLCVLGVQYPSTFANYCTTALHSGCGRCIRKVSVSDPSMDLFFFFSSGLTRPTAVFSHLFEAVMPDFLTYVRYSPNNSTSKTDHSYKRIDLILSERQREPEMERRGAPSLQNAEDPVNSRGSLAPTNTARH